MNDHDAPNLLKDVLELYAKYGTSAFRELASQLRDQQFVLNAVALLENAVSALPACKSREPRKKATKPKQSLLDLAVHLSRGEASREKMLTALARILQDRRTLKTLSELQRFAGNQGLSIPASSKRTNAVRALLEVVAVLPNDRLSIIVDSLSRKSEAPDSSLQAWSDIILKKRDGDKG